MRRPRPWGLPTVTQIRKRLPAGVALRDVTWGVFAEERPGHAWDILGHSEHVRRDAEGSICSPKIWKYHRNTMGCMYSAVCDSGYGFVREGFCLESISVISRNILHQWHQQSYMGLYAAIESLNEDIYYCINYIYIYSHSMIQWLYTIGT